MRRFHLIAVTPDLSKTMAIQTSAGWLLPWLDDNARDGLPEQVHAILNPLVSACHIVHEAPAQDATSPDQILQGYCAVVASGSLLSTHVQFVLNADLLASPWILPLQRDAWSLGLQRLRTPVADFDSDVHVAATLEWAERRVWSEAGGRVLSMARHRCSRHEYVVRLHTTEGTMYLKGGRERVADEGVLTHLLHGLLPNVVPETLALDLAAGRWLYRELAGTQLGGAALTMGTVLAVVPCLADLQKRAAASSAIQRHLATRCLTAADLFHLVDQIVGRAFAQSAEGETISGTEDIAESWQSIRDAIAQRCLTVDSLGLPHTVVLSDFWARNILMTSTGVGFIDLERSYWTLPLLPLWRFIHDSERALQTGGSARVSIEATFVSAWADLVEPREMTTALAELPLLGRLFELLLLSRELDLRERDLGSPLSTRSRGAALSRHARRLLECVVNRA